MNMATLKSPASHFSKLLKESKVVGQVDTKLEQVYTSYNGHLNQSRDFGLKRCLPTKFSPKSPWIRLKSLDTSYQQTDYVSGSAQASVVRMWRQIELGVKTARKRHAPLNVSTEPKPIRIEYSWFDEKSCESAYANLKSDASLEGQKKEKGRVKNIWSMEKDEFNSFLEKMRVRREDFRRYLALREGGKLDSQSKEAGKLEAAEEDQVDFDLYQYAQQNPDQIRKDIEDFISYLAENEVIDHSDRAILHMPHPNLGLNYAHFDLLHNERLTPLIPGRILDQADVKSNRQSVSFAGVVATMQRSSHIDLPSTSFEPDLNGYHNLDQGSASFRLESAAIDPYELPSDHDFQGFKSQFDQPVRYTDPRDKPKALGPNRLKVQVREGTHIDANKVNPNIKIGGMEWVGNEPPKRQGTIVLDFLSSVSKRISSQNSQNSGDLQRNLNGQSSAKTNQRGRISQDQNDQLLKVLQDLVGKP
ncbi:hypothetical protein BY996DRAFT_1317692 [Phakopsora pachyrhizi]|uniref:Uncharacterized protein n=1 Tax=Phakopsora pachyrhizi TaxID=170000 RepID=A0AAV0AF72_PHAPC|nr:hypothetical protein BY996DRAFT_1317692 [Phakopsora pachyrhizi]CAH7666559.1 hypothetical protein PPACK8108_LOCUS919 [Phakopsora pachyrhizi]